MYRQYALSSSTGVESIVAPVKVLTSNHKKGRGSVISDCAATPCIKCSLEHDQWKSEMSLETLLSIPAVKAVGRDEVSSL